MAANDHTRYIRATQANATVAVLDQDAGLAVVADVQRRAVSMLTESGTYYKAEIEEFRMAVLEIRSLQEKEEKAALAIEDEKQPAADCREKCCNLLHASRINGRKGIDSVVNKRSLIEAGKIGKEVIKETIFPLFSINCRELYTYFALALTLCIAVRSIVSFAQKDTKTGDDYVNIAFSCASWAQSIVDFVVVIYFHQFKFVRGLYRRYKKHRVADVKGSEEMHILDDASTQQADDNRCCCKLCCKNKYVDLIRMLLIEVLIYPVTISSMFKLFLNILRAQHSGNDIDIKAIASFAFQTLVSIVFVYGIRSLVLIRIIIAIQKERKNGEMEKTAKCFHIWFFLHVIGQMVVQVLMIICIGAKMYHENRNFSTKGNEAIQISPFLWYMIAGGLVIPFVGVFTFVIANYYSVQEYPIGFFLDLLLAVTEKRGAAEVPYPTLKKNEKGKRILSFNISPEALETAKVIAQRIKSDFNKIHNTNILNKYGYVFQSPILVALSIAYAIPLLAFAVCCVQLEPDPVFDGTLLIILNGSTGWIAFFILGVILVNLLNLPVLLVAGLWIAIIIGVIYLIFFFNVFLILFCFIAISCSNKR